MKTFRLKIIASYALLLVIFLSSIFPIITQSVQKIVVQSMEEAADALVSTIQQADDEAAISRIMKYQKSRLFFRIGIINDKLQLIYDSHTKHLFGSTLFPFQFITHPEVEEALRGEVGYSEKYSSALEQTLVNIAKKFDFHGKSYIILLSFPQYYIQELRNNFEYGFIFFSSAILILFSVMTALIFYHFTTPIKQILLAILPYQQGKSTTIPEIHLKTYLKDEFSQLADTLNSLSRKISHQIDTLTHEHNEKEALLQTLAEGVLAVDSNMCIIYANHNAQRLLRLSPRSVGQSFPELDHPRCTAFLKKAKETEKVVNEIIDITLNHTKMYLNVVTTPLKNGGALLVLHDMTTQYKLIEMRKDFIANASHELKTPITIIRGFAETLHENPHLAIDTVRDITEKIVRNCRRMTKTIKNLLTLADIEKLPTFKLQHCDMHELIAACKNSLLAIYPEARVTIHSDVSIQYYLDVEPELLEVAFFNLLDNAAKYSKETPEIDIFLTKKARGVEITIQDRGIGIPKQDLEHIFQRFYTVNKTQSKKLGGSGLGLSIVETIIQKHFGTIAVESTVGEGSRFTVFLPDDIHNTLSCEHETKHV